MPRMIFKRKKSRDPPPIQIIRVLGEYEKTEWAINDKIEQQKNYPKMTILEFLTLTLKHMPKQYGYAKQAQIIVWELERNDYIE